MALFGFSKSKRDKGETETILAYLEDLQRTRTPIRLEDSKGKGVDALVTGLDESAETLTLQTQGPLVGASKGDEVGLLFMADNLRVGGSSRIQELKGSTFTLELPMALEIRERRKAPRARLNPKEGASMTALTSLFEGTGINGTLENVSAKGARVRIEKAMAIKGEKKLPLAVSLFSKGQELMIIKLNQVPKCPTPMEMSGKVVYLEQSNAGLCMGVSWDSAPSALSSFVNSRASTPPKSVPPKTRRRPQTEDVRPSTRPTETPEPARTPAASPAAPQPAAGASAPAAVPGASAPGGPPANGSAVAVAPTAAPVAAPPANPLVRLRKRTRVAVALVPEPLRPHLEALLQEDGYGRVLLAGSLEEAEACLMVPNLAWIFLDPDADLSETLGFAARMHMEHPECPPVLVAAEEISVQLVKAAQGCGVAQLVVKPYGLDQALLTMLEGHLEG